MCILWVIDRLCHQCTIHQFNIERLINWFFNDILCQKRYECGEEGNHESQLEGIGNDAGAERRRTARVYVSLTVGFGIIIKEWRRSWRRIHIKYIIIIWIPGLPLMRSIPNLELNLNFRQNFNKWDLKRVLDRKGRVFKHTWCGGTRVNPSVAFKFNCCLWFQ